MKVRRSVSSLALSLLLCLPVGAAAQSVLMQAKTSAGNEVATIRTDSMRLLVPLHLLVGGLLFPDGTVQTTAAGGATSVTSADIVDGTIVNADISASAAIADTKLARIQTTGKVANSATTATPANVASTIVERNGWGGFEAGYVVVRDSLRVFGQGSFLATGAFGGTAPPPASGVGTRMMWYPDQAAFRAGAVGGSQWDAGNIGPYSVAFGYNTTASTGAAFAAGWGTIASAYVAFAAGYGTTASGDYSFADGDGSTASGSYSTAFGSSTIASGPSAFAAGGNTVASAQYSDALGYSTTASGAYSTAIGNTTTAQAYNSFVIGRYNVIEGTQNAWNGGEPLFAAGNGNPTAPSNALTLYKDGNLTIAGTLTQSSDARLKEDMEPLGNTLGKVMQLTPIRYRFRPGMGRPSGEQIGLTAQQVQPLFPELVKQDGDGYLSLSYANLSAVLVKAVQEQQAEIRTLRQRNGELESTVRAMRSEVAALKASQSEMLGRLRALEAGGSR